MAAAVAALLLPFLQSPSDAPVVSSGGIHPRYTLERDLFGATGVRATHAEASFQHFAETRATRKVPSPEFLRFGSWLEGFSTASAEARESLREEGEVLARARRNVMSALLRTDPETALGLVLPAGLCAALPASIRCEIETPICGRGDLQVTVATPAPGGQETSRMERWAILDGSRYRASVYGRRLTQLSGKSLPLEGIALDGWMAVQDMDPAHGTFAASGGEGGGGSLQEGLTDFGGPWSPGRKRVLYMRVIFPDFAIDPEPYDEAVEKMHEVGEFMAACSYGAVSLETTVTPLITLPKTLHEYNQGSTGHFTLYQDAQAAAEAAGFVLRDYDLDCVRYVQQGPGYFAGLGMLGGRGCWIKYPGAALVGQELGHNFAFIHASSWYSWGDSPVGAGIRSEYGDPYDVMGSGADLRGQFNPALNWQWLPEGNVLTVAASGTYRLHAFDHPVLEPGRPVALKIKKWLDHTPDTYWLGFRQRFTDNDGLMNGIQVFWKASPPEHSMLLDMTPKSEPGGQAGVSDVRDGVLRIGRTYSDDITGVHVTPVAKGGTVPESMDIVVNFGAFPGNRAPRVLLEADRLAVLPGDPVIFTMSATDEDGDRLAYDWAFGDGQSGTNAAGAVRAWDSPGEYRVQCAVTDMKGGVGRASLTVVVGIPETFRIRGRVTYAGSPLEGVRLSVPGQRTFSDSDGTYELVGLPHGTYAVGASRHPYSGFAPDLGDGSATLGPDRSGLDFHAVGELLFAMTGSIKAYDGVTRYESPGYSYEWDNYVPVPGVLVSDGIRSSVTDAAGRYFLYGVPRGIHTLTATQDGYAFRPAGWANPIVVDGGGGGANFYRPKRIVTGAVLGADRPATVSDGVRSVTSARDASGAWIYRLAVPEGFWSLRAVLDGRDLQPRGFSNPVEILADLAGADFDLLADGLHSVRGTVTVSGKPWSGVRVSDGTLSVVTDQAGHYVLSGLQDGVHELRALKSPYLFAPDPLRVTVSGADLVADFAGHANTSPSLTAIGSRSMLEDGTFRTQFAVKDSDTPDAGLLLSVESSNADLLPPSRILISDGGRTAGAGRVKNLDLTPLPDRSGSAVVTLVASDGSLSVSRSFTLTVTAVNDAPTLRQAAAVGENPVSGRQVAVQALGQDVDDAEGSLSYLWSGEGPAAVSFETNGVPEASATTARFVAPGEYVLTVRIQDPAGLFVESRVAVTVTPLTIRVSVSAKDSLAEEGHGKGKIRFSRTGKPRSALKVRYALTGSALHGTDYEALSGELEIPKGEKEASVRIRALEDLDAEPDESVILTLVLSSDYDVGPEASATVTIRDRPPKKNGR